MKNLTPEEIMERVQKFLKELAEEDISPASANELILNLFVNILATDIELGIVSVGDLKSIFKKLKKDIIKSNNEMRNKNIRNKDLDIDKIKNKEK